MIAEIQAPFGLAGEVRARILTDFPKRFARLKEVYLGAEARLVQMEASRLHQADVLLKLAGVDTPEEAAKLRLQLVQVPVGQAVKLQGGAYYHHQVVGLAAETTEGAKLGCVTEILSTGANDVYVVTGPEGEWLIPAVAQVVRAVDLAGGRLVVALMDGMSPEPPKPPRPPRPPKAPRKVTPPAAPPPGASPGQDAPAGELPSQGMQASGSPAPGGAEPAGPMAIP